MTSPMLKQTTSRRLRIVSSTLTLTLCAAGVSAPAWAHLGGDVASVMADSATLRAPVRTTATVQYDVHEISNNGLVVHEYTTRQGQVFAVTWRGPSKPDLQKLLGDYFSSYQSAASRPHAGSHRFFRVSQPNLVVESSALLRTFQGVAYIPSLVPAGMSLSELR